MKKTYKLENLDCANCAAKMETAIGKIHGVESVSISFMTQKLLLEIQEGRLDEILPKAQKAIQKIEPACKIV